MAEPANTPVPGSTPRSASPVLGFQASHLTSALSPHKLSTPFFKPRVLHIGDPVRYNPETFSSFSKQCEVIRPSAAERQRPEFIRALKEHRWGDFHAIFRPFWGTGGEMGNWDAELVQLLPSTVEVFASAGAGFDWADVKLFGERGMSHTMCSVIWGVSVELTHRGIGIIYCNSGLAAAEAVADFGMAMIISTFRQLPYCMVSAMATGTSEWESCHRDATGLSHNLRGHVLGLIGLGNIGQQIATRSRYGFNMDIHYYDVVPKSKALENSLKAVSHPTLESLMRASDCVILCTPAGQGTVINAESLAWVRPGTRFVNVARGSLVDEDAVADALEDGRLSSVALDVHRNEPYVHERLRKFAVQGRAMLTCHNAGGTVETHKGFEELSMRNIMAVLAGGEAVTPVNMQYLKK